ncbi:hypothetical protein C0J52_27168 [Blattella germanica]|nr:hypothetical protein C0J52_27168 [Blattella germanica]
MITERIKSAESGFGHISSWFEPEAGHKRDASSSGISHNSRGCDSMSICPVGVVAERSASELKRFDANSLQQMGLPELISLPLSLLLPLIPVGVAGIMVVASVGFYVYDGGVSTACSLIVHQVYHMIMVTAGETTEPCKKVSNIPAMGDASAVLATGSFPLPVAKAACAANIFKLQTIPESKMEKKETPACLAERDAQSKHRSSINSKNQLMKTKCGLSWYSPVPFELTGMVKILNSR